MDGLLEAETILAHSAERCKFACETWFSCQWQSPSQKSKGHQPPAEKENSVFISKIIWRGSLYGRYKTQVTGHRSLFY